MGTSRLRRVPPSEPIRRVRSREATTGATTLDGPPRRGRTVNRTCHRLAGGFVALMVLSLLPAAVRSQATGLLHWEPVPEEDTQASGTLRWEAVPADEQIDPAVAAQEAAEDAANSPPLSAAQAAALVRSLPPSPDDYKPLTSLGGKFPSAFVLSQGEVVFSAFQLSPVAGGGDAGGTGNQNFVAQVDLGLTDNVQLSGFFSDADDPLFSQPVGTSPNPANIWRTWGAGAQWQLIDHKSLGFAIAGSLENFFVESGGCRSVNSSGCSANIFNGLRQEVSTNNIVGSLSAPLTWKASPTLAFTLAPGVSFLPSHQGSGQGGEGDFFGTNITLSAGVLWSPLPQLRLYGSTLVPLGPGTNTFNNELEFSRVPIFSGGLQYALNSRIAFDVALTNGFGASPATALLTIPSSNELLWMAKWSYVPGASDSAALPWTERTRSLSMGGLTVGTAIIPAAGKANLWLSADNKGSLFGQAAYSLSNDFQIFWQGSSYEQIGTDNAFARNYVGDSGSFGNQVGGKAIFFHQLRGAPFSLAAAAAFGQDARSGYLFGELIATWEANSWLSLTANPKLVRAGDGTPVSIGLGANIQLSQNLQLIPEVNLATNDTAGSNASLALRWLPSSSSALDLYVSNAAGLSSVGQLLENVDQTRVGARITLQF